jgi:hypothetical protein
MLKEKHGVSVVASTTEHPYSKSGRLLDIISSMEEFRKFANEHPEVPILPLDFPLIAFYENFQVSQKITDIIARENPDPAHQQEIFFTPDEQREIDEYLEKIRKLNEVNEFDFKIPEHITNLVELLEFRKTLSKHIFSAGFICDFEKFKSAVEKDTKYSPLLQKVIRLEKRRSEAAKSKKPAKTTSDKIVGDEITDVDVEALIRNPSDNPLLDNEPGEIPFDDRRFANVSIEDAEKNMTSAYQHLRNISPNLIAESEDDFVESCEFLRWYSDLPHSIRSLPILADLPVAPMIESNPEDLDDYAKAWKEYIEQFNT